MRCVLIENQGPNSSLLMVESPAPELKDSQILVRVRATAVNRVDLMQRQGIYPPPAGASATPGLELAGDVVAVGAQVTEFKPGTRVYGLVSGGAYAELCAVEASLAHKIPDDWSYLHAAALPEALITSYATLFDLGRLKSGQTLLMHGAGSGISSLAIQIARLSNATVLTTIGHPSKLDKALALGASQVIHYQEDDFEALIEPQSVDVVIDFIGGSYFNKHLRLLKPQGKLIQIACLQGSQVACNLALLMRKRLHLFGFVLRSQTTTEKTRLWALAHRQLSKYLNNTTINPVIDSEFRFDELEKAHQRMLSGRCFGKIVISMG